MGKFDDIIRDAKRDSAREGLVRQNIGQFSVADKAGLAERSADNLTRVVVPLMRVACTAVNACGASAFLEEEINEDGHFASVTLRFNRSATDHPPALAFEDDTTSSSPALSYRIEGSETSVTPSTGRIMDPTPEAFSRIIEQFLTQVFTN
ncbi:MAG: hypothetical protein EOP88_12995 [Verrucomicrobiaceae bacterium]|nr:MAG: hypothetical protein EOP88_12995 [Verrucomicrobiaceae bacterium]